MNAVVRERFNCFGKENDRKCSIWLIICFKLRKASCPGNILKRSPLVAIARASSSHRGEKKNGG
ncbi:MAG: hypothetical protein ACTSUN_10340 [Promethearchaeota archaeon]